jgi:uncharacterized protein (DUF2267 family)
VDYDKFLDTVAQRAEVSTERATALTRATLETLAERITSGEARDLAAQLPKQLQQPLAPRAEHPQRFGLDEFVRRVSQRAGVDDVQAQQGVRAVFTTLREAVTRGEFDDVLSQLQQEFTDVIEPAAGETARPQGGGEPR